MISLQQVPRFLMDAMRADARLALAEAAVWLDPVHFFADDFLEDAWYDIDEESLLIQAVSIARRCLPGAYAGVVYAMRQKAPFDEVEDVFCDAFNAAYPHMDLSTLEDIHYGLPLSFLGVDPETADFIHDHPRLARVLTEDFSLPLSDDRYRAFDEDDLSQAADVARLLRDSLRATGTQPYIDLLFLLAWLFAASGNSIVDWTAEEWYDSGFEPLHWEPDQLAFADEVHAEASTIVDAALRALDVLEAYPPMRLIWRENIARARRAKEENDTHVRLTWPEWDRIGRFEDRHPGTAASDAALLLVRGADSEEDG